jgi:hypothetical protein
MEEKSAASRRKHGTERIIAQAKGMGNEKQASVFRVMVPIWQAA